MQKTLFVSRIPSFFLYKYFLCWVYILAGCSASPIQGRLVSVQYHMPTAYTSNLYSGFYNLGNLCSVLAFMQYAYEQKQGKIISPLVNQWIIPNLFFDPEVFCMQSADHQLYLAKFYYSTDPELLKPQMLELWSFCRSCEELMHWVEEDLNFDVKTQFIMHWMQAQLIRGINQLLIGTYIQRIPKLQSLGEWLCNAPLICLVHVPKIEYQYHLQTRLNIYPRYFLDNCVVLPVGLWGGVGQSNQVRSPNIRIPIQFLYEKQVHLVFFKKLRIVIRHLMVGKKALLPSLFKGPKALWVRNRTPATHLPKKWKQSTGFGIGADLFPQPLVKVAPYLCLGFGLHWLQPPEGRPSIFFVLIGKIQLNSYTMLCFRIGQLWQSDFCCIKNTTLEQWVANFALGFVLEDKI